MSDNKDHSHTDLYYYNTKRKSHLGMQGPPMKLPETTTKARNKVKSMSILEIPIHRTLTIETTTTKHNMRTKTLTNCWILYPELLDHIVRGLINRFVLVDPLDKVFESFLSLALHHRRHNKARCLNDVSLITQRSESVVAVLQVSKVTTAAQQGLCLLLPGKYLRFGKNLMAVGDT